MFRMIWAAEINFLRCFPDKLWLFQEIQFVVGRDEYKGFCQIQSGTASS